METMEALGLSLSDLAGRIHLPEADLRSVIDGRSPIGIDMAGRLESALQVPQDFWLALDRQYQDRRRAVDEAKWRRQRIRSSVEWCIAGVAITALIACPALAIVLQKARAEKLQSERRVVQARVEAADEGFAAATQPTEVEAPARTVGYVYLGTCDKSWSVRKFGWLPDSCQTALPSDGKRIVSWKGDSVRSALPTTTPNGRRSYGQPLGSVRAGYTVILHEMYAVSAYQDGRPQHYWGKVELPESSAAPAVNGALR